MEGQGENHIEDNNGRTWKGAPGAGLCSPLYTRRYQIRQNEESARPSA